VLANLAQLAQWSTFVLEILKLITFSAVLPLLKRAMVRRLPDAAHDAAGAVLGLAFIFLWCVMILGDAQGPNRRALKRSSVAQDGCGLKRENSAAREPVSRSSD